jgi:uncharacterized protein
MPQPRRARISSFRLRCRSQLPGGSDIDFLVEFLPGKKIGLFEYAAMQMELEGLLRRKVDLVSRRGLKPLIREDVLSKTWNVYAA